MKRHRSPIRLLGAVLFGAIMTSILACADSSTVQIDDATDAGVPPAPLSSSPGLPRFGFTPFPYDLTLEAVDKTYDLIARNSTLHAIQLDNGIPWRECLTETPWPREFQEDWDGYLAKIPRDRPLYVSIAPLADDRQTLSAPAKGSALPRELNGVAFDDEKLKKSYLYYARRVVREFRPTYLNLGQEAGQLAFADPKRWPQFEGLYHHVRTELKRENPELSIGISFVLHSLMSPPVAQRARNVVRNSDYLGLSFFPFASELGEREGLPALPKGPDAWRQPLAWARKYSSKPIAICETAYATQTAHLRTWNVTAPGDESSQATYVTELGAIAKRDAYPFVIWFCVADYDKLYEKLEDAEIALLWRHTGFLDKDLKPKPAWTHWQNLVQGASAPPLGDPESPAPTASVSPESMRPSVSPGRIGFSSDQDLFVGPDPLSLDEVGPNPGVKSLKWDYKFKAGEFNWCTKKVTSVSLHGATKLSVWVRSDRDGDMMCQLEEASGEAWFASFLVHKDWMKIELKLDRFQIDPEKKQDGRLDPAQVAGLMFADPAGTRNESGGRTVWFADLVID